MNHFTKKLLVFSHVMLTFGINAIGQINKNSFDRNSFLVGTLYDRYARVITNPSNNCVDYYYLDGRVSIANAIDSLFNDENHTILIKDKKLYSEELCKIVDQFYDFKLSKWFPTTENNTAYKGKLKFDCFVNDEMKYSFLSGVFARYGLIDSSSYAFMINASQRKGQVCEKILKEIGCKNVEYEVISKPKEVEVWVHFEPTPKLLTYFEMVKSIWIKAQRMPQ